MDKEICRARDLRIYEENLLRYAAPVHCAILARMDRNRELKSIRNGLRNRQPRSNKSFKTFGINFRDSGGTANVRSNAESLQCQLRFRL